MGDSAAGAAASARRQARYRLISPCNHGLLMNIVVNDLMKMGGVDLRWPIGDCLLVNHIRGVMN